MTLIDFLGGTNVARNKMKETGTKNWLPHNDASNESGFTETPGGSCYGFGPLLNMGVWSIV